jgi:hypothetical protein
MITITSYDHPTAAESLVVSKGLEEFNNQVAPLHEVRPLSVFAPSPGGPVIGGAVGRT